MIEWVVTLSVFPLVRGVVEYLKPTVGVGRFRPFCIVAIAILVGVIANLAWAVISGSTGTTFEQVVAQGFLSGMVAAVYHDLRK